VRRGNDDPGLPRRGVHAALRAHAAASGMSLSPFVLRELEAIAARPSKQEVLSRAAQRGGRLSFDEAVEAVAAARRGER
jgi:hypothetical protein